MAQCVYYKKRHKKRKLIVFLSALFLIAAGIYIFIITQVRPVIRTISQEYIRALTVESVNRSVIKVMNENPSYIDMTRIERDQSGNIVMIHTDSSVVNALTLNVTLNAQTDLQQLNESGIAIPVGSLSGISFLSGIGPEVHIRAIQIGNINTVFSSRFISAGINQTLHKMYLDITASVNIVIPGAENKITTTTQVLIGESVIIGKVPDVYLSGKITNGSYDLVP